jgi:hypothetical protein
VSEALAALLQESRFEAEVDPGEICNHVPARP